jgi:transposase InsO family protein
MDFFTVPTLTFGVLYCFFVIGHDRRKILRFNVTRSPNALWIVQQLREAWPYVPAHKFLLFDRDSKFGTDVISAVRELGSQPTRTAFRSPWQNGVAERWVGSCRRDLLDHVIVLNEQHLKRLMAEYVRYYHEDRTHLGLDEGYANRSTSSDQMWDWRAQSTPSLDSVDCTIVTPLQLSLRQLCLSGQLLIVPSEPRGRAFVVGRARGLE